MVLKAPRSSVKFIPQRHSHGGRCWAGRGGDTAMLALGPKHNAPETQDSQAAFVRQGAYIFIQSASGGREGLARLSQLHFLEESVPKGNCFLGFTSLTYEVLILFS